MPTDELELSKINRNMIRLAEFLLNVKKEQVEIPHQLNHHVEYFINYQYGLDIDQNNIERTLDVYQKHLQSVQRKMNKITISKPQELNARILNNILNETDFLISIFIGSGIEQLLA